jgi:hypothetical protein
MPYIAKPLTFNCLEHMQQVEQNIHLSTLVFTRTATELKREVKIKCIEESTKHHSSMKATKADIMKNVQLAL